MDSEIRDVLSSSEGQMKRKYTEEFKKETVRQVQQSSISKSKLVKTLGISRSMLYRWIEIYGCKKSAPLTEDERKELIRLQREYKQLETEHELLKKVINTFSEQSR